jgi:UDP-N-acetylmuramoyl-L-alanyl-D-glutamate--2,6-diaminopimelate ligase
MLTLESLFAAIDSEEGLRPFQLKVFNMGKSNTVTGIAYDSRKVGPGTVFVCVKGEHADGHNYIGQAVRAKACCIVVEDISKVPIGLLDSFPVVIAPKANKALALLANKFYAQPAQNLLMIGVTGTNGKTTVTHLLQSILQEAKLPQDIKNITANTPLNSALLGTLGFKGSQQGQYTKTGNTTPMAVEFQQILSHAKAEDFNTIVMEVSSHALDQDRVLGCEFDVAVITNLTQDHLDYHKTMQDYFKAKALLFKGLKPTPQQPKWAIINLDDEWAPQFISVCPTNVNVITYSLNNPEATLSAKNVSYSVQGATLTICTPQGELPLTLNIAGQFGVYNALAAFAAA